MVTDIKWSSLQKSVSKITRKKFYEIYPIRFEILKVTDEKKVD